MGIFVGNPVLHKEVALRLRIGTGNKVNRTTFALVATAAVVLLYVALLRVLLLEHSHNTARDFFQIGTMVVETSIALLLTPALLAGAIALEREKQTWNALLLSRLSPLQIVVGKLVGGLVPCAILFALFLPITALAAVLGGVSPRQFAASHLVLGATSLLAGSIGLFCSWVCRRSQLATAAAIGSTFALVALTPLAFLLWSSLTGADHAERFTPLWTNPYFASAMATATPQAWSAGPRVAPEEVVRSFVVFAIGLSALLLTIVTRRLAHGPKEMVH